MGVTCHDVPAALAYWTDHPSTDASTDPLLWISMKSLVSVALAFPPPPYTWLITTGPATASIPTSRPAPPTVLGAVVSASLEHAANAPPKTERTARTLSERARGIETPIIVWWNRRRWSASDARETTAYPKKRSESSQHLFRLRDATFFASLHY